MLSYNYTIKYIIQHYNSLVSSLLCLLAEPPVQCKSNLLCYIGIGNIGIFWLRPPPESASLQDKGGGGEQDPLRCDLSLLSTGNIKTVKLCLWLQLTFSTGGFRLCSALENWLLTILKLTIFTKLKLSTTPTLPRLTGGWEGTFLL